MASHLVVCIALLMVFYWNIGDYLNNPASIKFMGRVIRFVPLYLVWILSFWMFLYLLPGLCDPEVSSTKRMPFMTFNYMIMAVLTIAFFNVIDIESL